MNLFPDLLFVIAAFLTGLALGMLLTYDPTQYLFDPLRIQHYDLNDLPDPDTDDLVD